MNLTSHLKILIAGLSLLSVIAADAQNNRGGGAIVPGAPGRPNAPVRPNPPAVEGKVEQKQIVLNRRVQNEQLPLRQLMGIDQKYRGYNVQRVVVDVIRSGPRSLMTLEVNGRPEDSVAAPYGQTVLKTGPLKEIGTELQSLQLSVSGNVFINSITVFMRDADRGGPVRPGREEVISLAVNNRLFGNAQLDLTRFIDMHRYNGARIVAIEVDANAAYNQALMDLFVNNMSLGRTQNVDRFLRTYTFQTMRNETLGRSATRLVLSTRGDIDIRSVRLIVIR
jgi:hypothetical protein